MLEKILAISSAPGLGRIDALRRAIESPLDRVRRELSEMAELYEEGSRTETAEGQALVELRIRRKLAGLRAQENADVWSAIAPMHRAVGRHATSSPRHSAIERAEIIGGWTVARHRVLRPALRARPRP